MTDKFLSAAAILLACLVTANLSQAEEQEFVELSSLDCAAPVQSGSNSVKHALGHLYLNGASHAELTIASRRVNGLITHATYCQVELQSQAERADHMLIAEWRSLYQWLGRLADTLQMGLSDPEDKRWLAEYTLFAEVYEFTP